MSRATQLTYNICNLVGETGTFWKLRNTNANITHKSISKTKNIHKKSSSQNQQISATI
jgi:hypothetical protein